MLTRKSAQTETPQAQPLAAFCVAALSRARLWTSVGLQGRRFGVETRPLRCKSLQIAAKSGELYSTRALTTSGKRAPRGAPEDDAARRRRLCLRSRRLQVRALSHLVATLPPVPPRIAACRRPVPRSRRLGFPLRWQRRPSPAGSRPSGCVVAGGDGGGSASPGAGVATPGPLRCVGGVGHQLPGRGQLGPWAASAITAGSRPTVAPFTSPRAHVVTPGLFPDGPSPAGSRPSCHIAPCPRRDAGAMGAAAHHLPDRGQAATHIGRDHHQHRPVPASRRRAVGQRDATSARERGTGETGQRGRESYACRHG
jgi:hypothetical protein